MDGTADAKRKSFAENSWLYTLHTSKKEIRQSTDPLIITSCSLVDYRRTGFLEEYWDENTEGKYKLLLNNHTGEKTLNGSQSRLSNPRGKITDLILIPVQISLAGRMRRVRISI